MSIALYVHIPWCVAKCPYCDFNSHGLNGRQTQEAAYVDALLRDLAFEHEAVGPQAIDTVFFGGGTPSLFSAAAIGRILDAADAQFGLSSDAEITLEANPGASEAQRFAGYRTAGVNRLSIGVQSLDDALLQKLGRIHDSREARAAVDAARSAGFDNLNLDLMFALPGQTVAGAAAELDALIALGPEHISYYQLTLEPGTAFGRRPPALPNEGDSLAIWDAGRAALSAAGYAQYEVSAYARDDLRCRHNLAYWRFGDYLGIGAGAHGKVAGQRRARHKVPTAFMRSAGSASVLDTVSAIPPADMPLEFMMNRLRLADPVQYTELASAGIAPQRIAPLIQQLTRQGLMTATDTTFALTDTGHAHLDTVVSAFLPDVVEAAHASRSAA